MKNLLAHIRLPYGALAIGAALALAFLGCEGDHARPAHLHALADLDRPDCRIGVWAGHDSETLARHAFPNAAIVPVEEPEDAFIALLAGKLEAFVSDEHILNLGRRAYPLRFRILEDPLERQPAVALLGAKNAALLADVNAFIAAYRRNGTYDRMFVRWCQADRAIPMPGIASPTNGAPELKIGTSGLVEPSSFIDRDGRLAGFDIEFGLRLAAALGRPARFILKPSGSFDNELRSGAVDLVLDNIDDPSPRTGIVFSDGYLDADMKVMVADADPACGLAATAKMLGGAPFGASDRLIHDPRIRLFANGFLTTLALCFLGTLLGVLLAARMPRVVRPALATLTWIPPIVLLLVLHAALLPILPGFLVAVLALALVFAARRAARPDEPLAEPTVAVLHWTAVVGTLNVFDLTMAADLVCGRAWAAFPPMLGIALAYAILARGIAWAAGRWERTRSVTSRT